MLALIFTVVACAMVVLMAVSLVYAIVAVLYEWGNDSNLDDVVREAVTCIDEEIEASKALMVKPVTPTGETAEIAASMEAKRRVERSKA